MPRLAESLRRHAALARAVLRARRGVCDPFKLTWIVTERCSQHCRTCHLWATEPAAGPDLDTVGRVVEANPQLTWCNLSGGDLVERPDAPELVARVAHGFPDLALLDFPTAGQDTEATLRVVEAALDSPVPRVYVTVSLDGPDPVHDRLRGDPGSAARARTTLRRLQELRRPGFRVVAGMTLSRHNLPQAPPEDPAALLPADVDPGDLHLNLAHHSGHYYRNATDVTPPAGSARAVIDHVRARSGWALSPLALIERAYWSRARAWLERGEVGGRCAALTASVYLAADLTVYPCTIYDRPLGSLADVGHALRRLPELAALGAAREEVAARACPGCWSPCEAFPTLLTGLGRPL